MTKNILILASEYPHLNKPRDGIFIEDQLITLNQHGIKTDIVFVEPRSLKELSINSLKKFHFNFSFSVENGINTYRWHCWNTYLNSFAGGIIYSILTFYLARKYIKEVGKPKIIHAHNTFWTGLSAYLLSKKYNIPFIITEHSSRFLISPPKGKWKTIAKLVLGSAESVIAVSNNLGQILETFGAKSISCIPNVINFKDFYIEEAKTKDHFKLLAVGNLTKNKAFDILIKAFKICKKYHPKLHLTIIGNGDQKNSLINLRDNYNLKESITFTGYLKRKEVIKHMQTSNALILSSYHETFGTVIIEALACGTPVISTTSGGPDSIITKKVGKLVKIGDYKSLADAIMETMSEDYNSNQLRDYVYKIYGEEAFIKSISNIYYKY
tara:strand:+ start:163 stop:1308 length:1146 start_codon:yes stop_codon:yes gene_type:complete